LSKRIVIISDTQCGHRAGLTPPGWQTALDSGDRERQNFAISQRVCWDWFAEKIDSLRPIHHVFLTGDAIDGKGIRSGGTEQIELDRSKQAEMAAQIINFIGAEHIVLTYGTPYHTGTEEDYELQIAKLVKADKIGGHEWVQVEDVIFDLKHKVGNSQIPHGRFTPIAREALWNLVWSYKGGQPRAQVLIRSHVHHYDFCGDADVLAMTTPALQGWGDKYGSRQCSGTVDIGFVHFDVEEGNYSWKVHLLKPKENAAAGMILKL
jgi:hypothetical protein